MENKILNIVDSMDEDDDVDEVIESIRELMDSSAEVVSWIDKYDTDVFDSPGMDVYYYSVSWIDENGELHLWGCPFDIC